MVLDLHRQPRAMEPVSHNDGHQKALTHVSHFVLHTSSLISLPWGSLRSGSPALFHRHSLLIICTNIKSAIHLSSFSQFWLLFRLLCFGCSSSWLPSLSFRSSSFILSELHLHLYFYSSQCCKRKLVAMLISLFDALRASSASILEKPISTNRATWRGQSKVDRCGQQTNQW